MSNLPEDNSPTIESSLREDGDEIVIPVLEEHATLSKHVKETGRVQVSKSVSQEKHLVETPVLTEEVEIKRVAINRHISEPAVTREEGNVTIVPVMEEVVIVTKQLVLREEIHLIRHTEERLESQEVTLETETVHVKRVKEN